MNKSERIALVALILAAAAALGACYGVWPLVVMNSLCIIILIGCGIIAEMEDK